MRWLVIGLAAVVAVAGLRFGLLATRQRRARAASARALAAPAPPQTLRSRISRALAMPVFLALVAIVLAAGVMAGMLISWTR